MKYWELIAAALTKAGWSFGYSSYVTEGGEKIYFIDAHRDDGKRYIVHADDLLTAFLEIKRQNIKSKKTS